MRMDHSNLKLIMQGDRRLLSKLLSLVEGLSEDEQHNLVMTFLRCKNRPTILGITGTPGAGKSTFLNRILETKRPQDQVGLILIDPSNPSTGGSILGDRVRMSDFFLDPSVFIRSISNRGQADGLNPSIELYLMLMCQFPFKYIFLETVGGGQTSVNIFSLADKTILVFDPASGDGIQHLKSGILDLADEIIISKADLHNTEAVKQSLVESLGRKVKISGLDLSKKVSPALISKSGVFNSEKINLNSDKIARSYFRRKILLNLKDKVEKYLEEIPFDEHIPEKMIRELSENFQKYFCQKA